MPIVLDSLGPFCSEGITFLQEFGRQSEDHGNRCETTTSVAKTFSCRAAF